MLLMNMYPFRMKFNCMFYTEDSQRGEAASAMNIYVIKLSPNAQVKKKKGCLLAKGWRVAEHVPQNNASLPNWLFWAEGTWEIVKAERGFLWTPFSKDRSPKGNPVIINLLPGKFVNQGGWPWSRRGTRVHTAPRQTLSQTIVKLIKQGALSKWTRNLSL